MILVVIDTLVAGDHRHRYQILSDCGLLLISALLELPRFLAWFLVTGAVVLLGKIRFYILL